MKEIVELSNSSKSAVSRMIAKTYPECIQKQGKKLDLPEDKASVIISRLKNKYHNMDINIKPIQFPNGNAASGKVDIEAIIEHTVTITLKMVMPLVKEMVTEIFDKTAQLNKEPQKQLPPAKIEVEITDLPDNLARVASAAINNKLKSDERKKRLSALTDDLF